MLTTYFVGSQSSTQDRSNDDRIDIIRQQSEIASVQGDVFLEASVFMMQVVRALDAMLLLTSQTKIASSANSTRKPDADILANLDIFIYPRT